MFCCCGQREVHSHVGKIFRITTRSATLCPVVIVPFLYDPTCRTSSICCWKRDLRKKKQNLEVRSLLPRFGSSRVQIISQNEQWKAWFITADSHNESGPQDQHYKGIPLYFPFQEWLWISIWRIKRQEARILSHYHGFPFLGLNLQKLTTSNVPGATIKLSITLFIFVTRERIEAWKIAGNKNTLRWNTKQLFIKFDYFPQFLH